VNSVEVNSAIKRRARIVEPGLIQINQVIDIAKTDIGTDVTGPYWILGFVDLKAGQISYYRGGTRVIPSSSFFGMFLPPYSIVQVELLKSISNNFGYASQYPLPSMLPKTPVLFQPNSKLLPESIDEALIAVKQATSFQEISRALNPSGVTLRSKRSN
jgi:hypothetical protein